MTPSAQIAGGRRVQALDPRDHHREDPRVERPLRRAAVLGRLEPVAGALARAGVARRALPRRGLAVDQRREAPVRRELRRRRARGRPRAAPARARAVARAGAARPDVRQRAPLGPRSVDDELLAAADARPRGGARAPPRSSAGCAAAERRAERAEAAVGEARRRARRASEREGRARRARDRVQVAEREVRELTAEQRRGDRRRRRGARARGGRPGRGGRRATRPTPAARSSAPRRARPMPRQRAEAAERLGAAAARAARERGRRARRGRAAREAEARAAAAERARARARVARVRRGAPPDAAELTALRAGGPSGPAVLAAALRELARARAGGSGPALDAALSALASAAIRWRDRL